MRSSLPKVLHPILGQPMISYGLQAATEATGERPLVVVGHQADEVCAVIGDWADWVVQSPQLGTAHAVMQAKAYLKGKSEQALVMAADMPLLSAETLVNLIRAQQENPGPLTLLTLVSENSHGFGRIVRDDAGDVREIVEEAHATPDQLKIQELNAGVYCFKAEWLWKALDRVPLSPKGEYYLTDLVGIAVADGLPVIAVRIDDASQALGVNNRVHLAEVETFLRQRINQEWMLAGVTLVDPHTTYIEPTVEIGPDTIIWPNTILRGRTVVGNDCVLGPNTIVQDAQVGSHCKIFFSVVEGAVLEDQVDIGPFAHLRKGAHLARGVHMGNFGEVKNSYLGPGTKMGHFSYVGDATIGSDVNIGAGTITCNYDGVRKNPTIIEDHVFIGSDTMLVAPVKIGERGRTGAGAVVTKDIPPYSLAVGVPARVIRKLEKDA